MLAKQLFNPKEFQFKGRNISAWSSAFSHVWWPFPVGICYLIGHEMVSRKVPATNTTNCGSQFTHFILLGASELKPIHGCGVFHCHGTRDS